MIPGSLKRRQTYANGQRDGIAEVCIYEERARGIDRSALAKRHNNLLYYSRDVIESKEGARVHCRGPAFFFSNRLTDRSTKKRRKERNRWGKRKGKNVS